jgi:tripartite-type tricarboxylate transporter receptor subunit TctC
MRAVLYAGAIALLAGTVAAAADSYPSKPVRVVVPNPPGGAVDVVTRKVAQKLTEQTKQTFFVENKPGATGTIGTQLVARAPADGYTLLANDNTYSILPYVFKTLPWDHKQALVPVTVMMFAPVLLAVPESSRFRNLGELIAAAKTQPDTVTFGTGGQGSAPHFAAEAFQLAAGIKLTHVPYKGAGEVMLGLISRQIDMALVSTPSAMAQLRSGKIRALAISGKSRLGAFPDLPTFAEAGLPNFSAINWSGLAVPAGTPPEIVTMLRAEVVRALASDDAKKFMADMGGLPGGLEPGEFARLIAEETQLWGPVAEKAGIERQ